MSFSEFKYKIKSIIQQTNMLKLASYEEGESINSVCLILINVGIGDAIMATSFIHELKKLNKSIDVIIAKKNFDIFTNNKDVRNVLCIDEKKTNQQKYDLVVDPYSHCGWFFSYRYYKLLSEMKYKYLSGFNVKNPSKYSDNFLSENDIHITDYYNHVLKKFFNSKIEGQYIVNIPDGEIKKAHELLGNIPTSDLKIAFCPFASTLERSFSDEQVNAVLGKLKKEKNISIIILCEEHRVKNINIDENVYFFKTESFISSAAILSLCDFCISSDTSFVHLANSKDIPLLAFYSSVFNDGFNTDFLCAPNYAKSKQIVESTGISNLNVSDIVNAILHELKLLDKVGGDNE
ncbi:MULTISPECIES: glycosyltransferase family 9 protein [Providencia]|uniref:glycosyltransferase family 9 protein n=2 Tax=Morganellaceae TaxID=1903414 RepID=UPI00197D0324|nr:MULTISPECIES: glycosyltransferase family 9 protein [Providencia]MBN4866473.1 glycosyltransferase family 9 protein [Providencia stuartii]MBN4875795.1 glycosyltransferase family 9 protein [Providencia stuartii]MBN4880487.1 glycosyltransferase family 9 protein [Providencia stuartii]MBN4884995.1 glycosyltransferase family 9 protein [Providencia stuartii]